MPLVPSLFHENHFIIAFNEKAELFNSFFFLNNVPLLLMIVNFQQVRATSLINMYLQLHL